MILQTFWSILLILFTVFMFLYSVISISVILDFDKVSTIKQIKPTTVREIVAYSLKKQIELEGEEYFCGKSFDNLDFPSEDTKFKFWEKLDDIELYVASVTLDKRLDPYHYLRIVGVIKGNRNHTLYCQIRTSDGHVHVIKSTVTSMWYEKWDMHDNNTYYNPILVSCRLPAPEMTSSSGLSATLSINPCVLPKKSLKIFTPFSLKQVSFTICVKPLSFQKDISKHLIEWIEICKILGAKRFHIFLSNVTNRTRRILKWYQFYFPNAMYIEDFQPVSQNCTSTSFSHEMWQRRRYEVVAYNMCFNKNINSNFVIPLDIDEVILPKSVRYWEDLVKNFDSYTSLIVQNVYYFMRKRKNRYHESPFFLSENRRNKVPSAKGENGKSFISTKNALTVFNHYALHSLKPGVIKQYFLPFRDVQLNHYKESCNRIIFPECTKYLSSPTTFDNIISKYKNEFEENYRNVINRLKRNGIKIS